MDYHQIFLNNIKKQIGASFIGYEEYKGSFQLKVIKNGQTTYLALEGKPDDVSPERYAELLTLLQQHGEQI